MTYRPGSPEAIENERLEHELAMYAQRHGIDRAPRLSPADRREAMAHAFAAALGHAPRSMHPAAENLRLGPAPFVGLAHECLRAAGRRMPAPGGDGFEVIAAALSTSDYPEIVTSTARGIAAAIQTDALADVLSVTQGQQVESFATNSFSSVDLDGLPLPSARTVDAFWYPRARLLSEGFQAYSVPAKLLFPREVLVGDSRGFVEAVVAAFAATAARNEAAALAAMLEANGNLQDGAAWFASAKGSDVSAAPLTVAGLAKAMAALRTVPTAAGEPANGQLAAVIVAPADEGTMLSVIEQLPQDRRPRCVVLPALTASTYWWAVAAPRSHPSIIRATLTGADPSAVSIGALLPAREFDQRTGEVRDLNGLHLECSHTVGLSAVSRLGICRCSKT
jgi:hypothetical protein